MTSIFKKFGFHEIEEPKSFFDVVCGMELTLNKIKHTVKHLNGTEYHFCSDMCKDHFVNDPSKYVN